MKSIIPKEVIIQGCSCGCRFMFEIEDTEISYGSVIKIVKCPNCQKKHPTEMFRKEKDISKEEWNFILQKRNEFISTLKKEL
jgi:hypothetical protein